MTTNFYINGEKVTLKAAKEFLGEKYNKILSDAKETFKEDPLIQNDFFINGKIITIDFE